MFLLLHAFYGLLWISRRRRRSGRWPEDEESYARLACRLMTCGESSRRGDDDRIEE